MPPRGCSTAARSHCAGRSAATASMRLWRQVLLRRCSGTTQALRRDAPGRGHEQGERKTEQQPRSENDACRCDKARNLNVPGRTGTCFVSGRRPPAKRSTGRCTEYESDALRSAIRHCGAGEKPARSSQNRYRDRYRVRYRKGPISMAIPIPIARRDRMSRCCQHFLQQPRSPGTLSRLVCAR